MTIQKFADKHRIGLNVQHTSDSVVVHLGKYQYTGTIQRDGSIYNDYMEIYHTSLEGYFSWVMEDYEESELAHEEC